MSSSADRRVDRKADVANPAAPSHADPGGEQMGASSFPASDPPAIWTWEPPKPTPSADSPTDEAPAK